MALLVSLTEIHRLTPIKEQDYDAVLNECDRAGIGYDDPVWHLEDVPVHDIPQDQVGDDDIPADREVMASLRTTFRVGLTSLVPPIIVLHDPGYTGGTGQPHQYMLWDGAHRWTIAVQEDHPTIRAWVAHIGHCCLLTPPRR